MASREFSAQKLLYTALGVLFICNYFIYKSYGQNSTTDFSPEKTITTISATTTTTTTRATSSVSSTISLSTNKPSASPSLSKSTASTTASTTTSMTTSTTTSATTSTTKTPVSRTLIIGLAVGISCFVILLVVAILLILFLCRKRRKKHSNVQSINLAEKVEGSDNPAFRHDAEDEERFIARRREELPPKPIKKSDLLRHIEEHQADMSKYRAEFNLLPGSGFKSCSVGKKLPDKNRYVNILPNDENRVCLTTGTDSDYINASYIDGYNKEKVYIAAQGPMNNTLQDFWRMIWEQNSNRVVMVTNIVEGEKLKCSKYWPSPMEKEKEKYGEITVFTVKEEEGVDYTTRTLIIKKGDVKRQVYQFHFITWPDQDVPDTCTSMLKFYQQSFRTRHGHKRTGPLIIHCSAGVGRTGTLIALDILVRQAKEEGIVDIQKCIEKLRLQRVNMVQSTAQYIFLHHALVEYLILGNVEIKNAEFKETYANVLLKPTERGKPTLIQRQYNVLSGLKMTFLPVLYGMAKAEENQPKNRSESVLPTDNYLPILKSLEEYPNTYINAVYVHGFHQLRPYIATQMPLLDYVVDFWRLVRDNKSAAIVMLNDITSSPDEKYWPEDGQTISVGNFEITNMCEIPTENILATDLRIAYTGQSSGSSKGRSHSDADTDSLNESEADSPKEPIYTNTTQQTSAEEDVIQVRHLRLLDWAAGRPFPKDKSTLLELYTEVEKCQNKNPKGCVVVHCLYGAERTGLFCALMNLMDEIKKECVVDVFNSVKRIQRTRPEFIHNMEQFTYLYELASTYLSSIEQVDYHATEEEDIKL